MAPPVVDVVACSPDEEAGCCARRVGERHPTTNRSARTAARDWRWSARAAVPSSWRARPSARTAARQSTPEARRRRQARALLRRTVGSWPRSVGCARCCSSTSSASHRSPSMRPGGDPRAALPLLRACRDDRRQLRRHGREVHRRRGDGRLGRAGRQRGRRRAGRASRARRRGLGRGSRRRGRRRSQLAARGGVVTGEVAITIGKVAEGMVLGDTVNSASRVQSVASPGTVLVDESTWRATSGAIAYAEVGDLTLKGKDRRRHRVAGLARRRHSARGSAAPRGSSLRSSAATMSSTDQGPPARDDPRASCASRVGHRRAGHRQEPPRVGVPQVRRRAGRDGLLAPGSFSRLRRGHHVLGARRDGADASGDQRVRGRRRARGRSSTPASPSSSPTWRSGAGSSRGSRIFSGLPTRRAATARSSSPRGAPSSSGSPLGVRRSWSSRTCSGRTRA